MTVVKFLSLFFFLCSLRLCSSSTTSYDFSSQAFSNIFQAHPSNGFVYVTSISNTDPQYNNKPGWLLQQTFPAKESSLFGLDLNQQFQILSSDAYVQVTALANFSVNCGNCSLIVRQGSSDTTILSWNSYTDPASVSASLSDYSIVYFYFTCEVTYCPVDLNITYGIFNMDIYLGTSKQLSTEIGAGVGIAAVVIIIIIVIVCVCRRCRRKRRERQDEEMQVRMTKQSTDSVKQLDNTGVSSQSIHSSSIHNSTNEVIGDRIDDIKITDTLGAGAFGEVYKGIWQSDTAVALKKITGGQIEEFNKEAKILYALHHPNVIRYLGLHVSKAGDTFMVMEFAQKGSLKDFLKNEKSTLKMTNRYELMISTARGMQYLESKLIIHRDLAARNVLVSVVDGKFQCKISDFGLSRVASEYKLHGQAIPFRWSPPELLRDETATPKSDVWSFGIVVHEILENGDLPYIFLDRNVDVRDYVLSGKRLPKSSLCSDALYKLMLQCWQENPEDRPSFKELLNTLKILAPTSQDDVLPLSTEVVGPAVYNNPDYQATSFNTVAPNSNANANSTNAELYN